MSPAHLGPTASGVPLTAGMALCWCSLLLTGLSKVTEPCIQENCTASLQQHSAHFLGRGQQQLVIISGSSRAYIMLSTVKSIWIGKSVISTYAYLIANMCQVVF